ncbi:MAG: Asp-tRNA(Asn)/Glu-tRNA(Gln) amidotransferase subunit GatC [Pseudomonadales bacterium]|nr:Asp-tRNA(Asn)/Glu-tRNA(Gln) amidotransferase subunit GatC [Gammaproteobacteria bacterium]NNL56877.1 Asp-tRNA(Asn)/Glu-tRNA(Gln) amidotransferase subunit GatC [Pseudomonadales bacterium]
MSITQQQISDTARLARIRLENDEVDAITQRITAILDLVDQMQAVDTSAVEPMANSLDAVQQLRVDQVEQPHELNARQARRDQLLACAPASEDGLFLVPKVIE